MSVPVRLATFCGALLLGIFVMLYRHHAPTIDSALHTSHLKPEDWIFSVMGPLCVLGAVRGYLKQPENFDWRWGFWLVVGAAMIYAEAADAVWLKEATCRIFLGRHQHNANGNCYQPN